MSETTTLTTKQKLFNFSISCELFRTVLESLSYISTSAHLFFHPNKGLYARTMDQHEQFLGEFLITRNNFEMDEYADLIEQPIDIPMYFEGLIELLTLLPKGYCLRYWPINRCLQGIHFEEIPTNLLTYSEQEDVAYLPTYVDELFPAVNLKNYPFAVCISKAELSHQIEMALVNWESAYVGICHRFVLLYTEANGRSQKIIPCQLITPDHPLIHQGFNDPESETKNHANPTNQNQLVYVDQIDHPCLIQQHSLRYLSFMCKARPNSDHVILAMSPQHGLAIVFPIRGYGLSKLNNKNILIEESYFRYRALPIQKHSQQQQQHESNSLKLFPETILQLQRKFEIDKILLQKKQNNG